MTEKTIRIAVIDANQDNYKHSPLWDNLDFAHIHFVSEDEVINAGDYFLYEDNTTYNVYQCKNYTHSCIIKGLRDDVRYKVKKLIASTDKNLQLLHIPSFFVETLIERKGELTAVVINDIQFNITNSINTKRLTFHYQEPE